MVGPPLAVNVDAAWGGEAPLTEREEKGRLRGPGYPDKTPQAPFSQLPCGKGLALL